MITKQLLAIGAGGKFKMPSPKKSPPIKTQTTLSEPPKSHLHQLFKSIGAKHLSSSYNAVRNIEHEYHTNHPFNAAHTFLFNRLKNQGYKHSIDKGIHTYYNSNTGHVVHLYQSKHGGNIIEHHVEHNSPQYVPQRNVPVKPNKKPDYHYDEKPKVLDKIRHALNIHGGHDSIWFPLRD